MYICRVEFYPPPISVLSRGREPSIRCNIARNGR
nr:MAG TPA: hypothetical protein [Bacteriophage sp.]